MAMEDFVTFLALDKLSAYKGTQNEYLKLNKIQYNIQKVVSIRNESIQSDRQRCFTCISMRYSAIEFQKDRKFGGRIEEVMMERRFSLRGGVLEISSTSCT